MAETLILPLFRFDGCPVSLISKSHLTLLTLLTNGTSMLSAST